MTLEQSNWCGLKVADKVFKSTTYHVKSHNNNNIYDKVAPQCVFFSVENIIVILVGFFVITIQSCTLTTATFKARVNRKITITYGYQLTGSLTGLSRKS